jgi:hypothetical protein
MFASKREGCDAEVYRIAKDCIEACFPKQELDDNISAECLVECFETEIKDG